MSKPNHNQSRQTLHRPGATPAAAGAAPTDAQLDAARRAESAEDGDDDSDQRIVRHGDADGRGDRGVTEDTARDNELMDLMSDAEYEALIRNEFEQVSLPQPPALRGWHLCWLTSNSQYDTIAKRQRIGYRPVRRDEMPGFDPSNGQDLNRYEGFVTCNEMVLHKIPEVLYQKMMNYFHHKRPADGDNNTLQQIKNGLGEDQEDSSGKRLSENMGTGFLEMERAARKVHKEARFA